jgi:trehalose-6-phosphate synthase
MPERERARRLAGAAEQVRTHDVAAWLQAQLTDLGVVEGRLREPSQAKDR